MVVIKAVLHPDEAAKVWTALERVAADRCRVRTSNQPAGEASVESCIDAFDESRAHVPAETVSTAPEVPDADRASVSAKPPTLEVRGHDVDARAVFAETLTSGGTTISNGTRVSAETPATAVRKTDAAVPGETSAVTAVASRMDEVTVSAGTNLLFGAVRKLVAFDRADALVELAEQLLRGTSPARSPTELVISVPFEALRNPSAAHADPTCIAATADGTGLSTQAIRRLACDCGVVPLVEDANGNPSQVGRKFRVIAGALKRALFNRDKTCRFPGCKARAFLEGHHMEHWLNGGPTVLRNIVALCSFHHRFVHEYGFTIELDPTTNTVTAYDTANHRSVSTLPRAAVDPTCADLGWPNIDARNDRYGITADTQTCWDTTPVDYPELVDHLIRADDRLSRDARKQD
jgi:hypothetical protein